MTQPVDPIGEADFAAFVDEQLQPGRRIEVEDYLSRHPEIAARVMADLSGRDSLRLAFAGQPAVKRLDTHDAARRLARALARDIVMLKLRRVAAVTAFLTLGWLAHMEFVSMDAWNSTATASVRPSYVDDAARAHRTALLRAGMHSQPGQPALDREEIRAATAITVPNLPEGWDLLDVQIFPSSAGPSVEMAIRADGLGTLSLFAVRPGQFNVMPAKQASTDEVTAVYWQIGDVAYALVGAAEAPALNQAAAKLARTLY
ncbi:MULTISPECIES: anti-sigma factor [Rhodomicrobium]|uniref:anti-sigma factor family protein n=1 Tax=Rhodomicrobium TaxID=1068 RepID=UPI000B4B60AB|nr:MULTISPECIES: anti-sigma factor [Rhodomicrobium]